MPLAQCLGEFCAVLYGPVHQVLSAVRINRESTFQGDVCIARIGPLVGTSKSIRIIKVFAFQGCPQGGVPLYNYFIKIV